MEEGSVGDQEKLNLWQRTGLRKLRKDAGRKRGEPLKPEDWQAYYDMEGTRMMRAIRWVWRTLPSSPRCGRCGAPFAGFGRYIVKPLGYTPSRKNPTVCASCVETSPPGGVTMRAGVLFADIRGFTAKSAQLDDPAEVSRLLTRFYGCAEDVFFPEAVIDKLIGDEVMALYLPDVLRNVDQDEVPDLMLAHGRRLLELVGYGTAEGPFAETGIGMDIGDAFVGNIGERALYDFTAVGDVVNTASRLQAQAVGGEIVFSERVAAGLAEPVGSREELDLKGMSEPQVAYRVAA
jgi:adenylate cyclase